jgi:hypothetical protein
LVIALIAPAATFSSALAETETSARSTQTASARQPIAAVRPQPLKPAEYRLAYKFRANEDVHMPFAVDSRMVVQKGPSTLTTTNQSTVERHFHVASVDADGSAIVDLFIDSVKLSYSFNGGKPTTYDTNAKDPPPSGFESVKDSIGHRGKVRFSARGTILTVPGTSPDTSADPSESFLDLLPEKSVHIGDEWSDDIKVKVSLSRNLSQKITLRRYYTLESVHENVATIRLRTVEITPVDDPQIRAQLVQRTPEGKMTFDLVRGAITARELNCSRTETGIMGQGSQIIATTHWNGSLR